MFERNASAEDKAAATRQHLITLSDLITRVNRFVDAQHGAREVRTATVNWNGASVDPDTARQLDYLTATIQKTVASQEAAALAGDYVSAASFDASIAATVSDRTATLADARARLRGTRVLDVRTVCGTCGGFVAPEELTPGTPMYRTHTSGRAHATLDEARQRLMRLPPLCGEAVEGYAEIAKVK